MSNDRNEAVAQESPSPSCTERLTTTFDRRAFVIASAGGIAASMLVPSRAVATTPVINQTGTASINAGQYCTLMTASGKISKISVANSSRANNLVVAISGAPASGIVVSVNGQIQPALNNIFTLPPNSLNYIIIATGNFAGTLITISNITNKLNDATASIQCVYQ